MLRTVGQQVITLTVAAVFGGIIAYFPRRKKLAKEQAEAENQARIVDKQAELDNKNSVNIRIDSIELAVFTMIKSQLIKDCSVVIRRGYVYIHELEAINLSNTTYVKMNGNGVVKVLMRDVEKLPIKAMDEVYPKPGSVITPNNN